MPEARQMAAKIAGEVVSIYNPIPSAVLKKDINNTVTFKNEGFGDFCAFSKDSDCAVQMPARDKGVCKVKDRGDSDSEYEAFSGRGWGGLEMYVSQRRLDTQNKGKQKAP